MARSLPDRYDLHEPDRKLYDLDEYDHLRRLFRLCLVHIYRNIRTCPVSELVRNLMRSLVCMEHHDWDGAIATIQREGGKPAIGALIQTQITCSGSYCTTDWVHDKVRSKFAFPAMCWERSFIPRTIWQVGDSTSNVIETLHSDVNQEGVGCSLLGGVVRARSFDILKLKSIQVCGISVFLPHLFNLNFRYTNRLVSSRHSIAVIGPKRRYELCNVNVSHPSPQNPLILSKMILERHRYKGLRVQDQRIYSANIKLKKTSDAYSKAKRKLDSIVDQSLPRAPGSQPQKRQRLDPEVELNRAKEGVNKAQVALQRAVETSQLLVGKGTGEVMLILPDSETLLVGKGTGEAKASVPTD